MRTEHQASRPELAFSAERNVPVVMRDGAVLRADVFHPTADGRFPTLVMRTPYSKSDRTPTGYVEFFAPRGYVVVVQDVRGRFESDGEFYPLVNEAEDGFDTIEWAARLPWSNGRVGTFGQSYHGATQYLLSPTTPPHLQCQVPISASSNFHASWVYRTGGAFQLGWMLPQVVFLSLDTARRKNLPRPHVEKLEQLVGFENARPKGMSMDDYRHLPLNDWIDQLAETAPYLAEYLGYPDDGSYWYSINLDLRHGTVGAPSYHIGSWYDVFSEGTLGNYVGVSRSGQEPARRNHKLLMGPWGHLEPYCAPTRHGAGEADFGPEAEIEVHEIELRWFDHWLRDVDTGLLDEPPVRIFVIGDDVWRDEEEWPLTRSVPTAFYLDAHEGTEGDGWAGRLSPTPPGSQDPDHYRYDPSDPTPTDQGNHWISTMGAYDQRSIQSRPDVLCYATAPLERPMEVTGHAEVTLFASSTATDTDFMVKLCDVKPDGYSQNVADGMVRARYRESWAAPRPIEPGQFDEYRIELSATSYVFKPGHRVLLQVASADFPRYDRNQNVFAQLSASTLGEPADQTVFHDRVRPSRLVVPVIPR